MFESNILFLFLKKNIQNHFKTFNFQETFKIKESEEIDYVECKDTNKTECVFLKKNYNSIDLTEVEQIDEFVDETNDTIKEQYRPPIGPILTQVCEIKT